MSEKMVWLDLETTGLEPDKDLILEVGIVITDSELNILEEFSQVPWQSPLLMNNNFAGNPVAWEMHKQSGLIGEVLASTYHQDDVEQMAVEFVRSQVPYKKIPLAGSTISFDRAFLYHQMRELDEYFHYRSIDVSSIKELAKYWYPDLPEKPKARAHRSIADIHESIDLLRYYREQIFKATLGDPTFQPDRMG